MMEVEFKHGKLISGDESVFNKFILENVGSSIHIVKVDSEFNTKPIWMNKQFMHILGYSFSEREKFGYSNTKGVFYHPDDLTIIKKGISKIFSNPGCVQSAPFRIKQKSGQWKWLMFTSRQITINGESDYLLSVSSDINDALVEYTELVQSYSSEIIELKKQLFLKEFTRVELEIVKLLCKGLTVRKIAEQRHRSPETINNHKRNIFKKAKVNKISELVAFAIGHGLGH